MCETVINYNVIRGLLTETIRHLEQLKILLEERPSKFRLEDFLSEVEYWICAVDTIRIELYGCETRYTGKMDLVSSIKELLSEISNAYKFVFTRLTSIERDFFVNVWFNIYGLQGRVHE